MNVVKGAARDDEIAILREHLGLQRRRYQDEVAQFGMPNNVDSCRFDDSDLRKMAGMLEDAQGTAASVRRARAAEYEAPTAPPADACDVLAQAGSEFAFPDPPCT